MNFLISLLLLLMTPLFLFATESKPLHWQMQIHPISDTATHLDSLVKTKTFLPYNQKNMPGDISIGNYVILLKSSFSWNKSEPATLFVSPTDHPYKLFVNKQLVGRFGFNEYNKVAVNYKSSLIQLSNQIVTSKENTILLVLYPRGEKTPPPAVYIDTYEKNSSRDFWQTLFYYSFVIAFWVLGLFIFLLFFTFWFASNKSKKEYLYFGLTSLFLALAYTNTVFAAPTHFEPLLWIISRTGFVAGAATLMTFISIYAGTARSFRWINRFFLFAAMVFFMRVVLLDSKDMISDAYAWASIYQLLPCMVLTLVHSIIKLIKTKSRTDFVVLLGLLLSILTASYDLWYVTNAKIPYFWTLVYGYAALEFFIVFVLSKDLWRVFHENRIKTELLRENFNELAEQKAQIEQVSSGKSRFLQNMAHEFKTPLQGLVTISDLLQNEVYNREELQSIIEALNAQMKRHLYNIQNVMDLSLIENDTIEKSKKPFEFSQLRETITTIFKNNERNHSQEFVSKSLTEIPQQFWGSAEHIARITVNLLTNLISVSTNTTVNCTFSWDREKNSLGIYLSNSMGVIHKRTAELLSKSPEEFLAEYSEDSPIDEIAVIAAIKLIPLLNGTIELQEKYGEIRIRFSLKEIAYTEVPTPQKGKILVAEDNPVNRMLICKILEKLGYDVQAAEDGLQAVEMVEEINPALILMDIQMPYMNGLEATKQIRLNHSEIVIIALTANANRKECIDAGMNDFLTKPSNMIELKKVIDHYLAA